MPARTCVTAEGTRSHCFLADHWTAKASHSSVGQVGMSENVSHIRCSHFPSKQSWAVKMLRCQSLLQMLLLLSKQPATSRSEWAIRGRMVMGGVLSIYPLTPPQPPPHPNSPPLFFWSFMCMGSGQLRSSKTSSDVDDFSSLCDYRRDRHRAGICSLLTGVCLV